jgi:signal transduction histidine kinase
MPCRKADLTGLGKFNNRSTSNRFIAAEVEFLQRRLGETIEVEAVGSAGLWPVGRCRPAGCCPAQPCRKCSRRHAKRRQTHDGDQQCASRQDYCSANPEVIPDQYVMIAVSDNGTGMPKDVVDQAFEPFFSTKA